MCHKREILSVEDGQHVLLEFEAYRVRESADLPQGNSMHEIMTNVDVGKLVRPLHDIEAERKLALLH